MKRYGWVRVSGDVEIRRAKMYRDAKLVFQELEDGAHLFVEEPLALQNGRTTRVLALAAGTIWSAFIEVDPDAYWHWVDVATWKRHVRTVAHVKMMKKDIYQPQILARLEKSLTKEAYDDFAEELDLIDAWGLMEYGVPIVEEIRRRERRGRGSA